MSKEYFNIEEDIFICSVYIPPENSSYYKNTLNIDPFSEPEKDIGGFMDNGNYNSWRL